MSGFSNSAEAKIWLDQFAPEDRDTAAMLLDELMLVNRDDFVRGIYQLLDRLLMQRENPHRPMALFAEREVDTTELGSALPYFPGTESGRATGAGVAPIITNLNNQEIGSEGIIANLITGYSRLKKPEVLSHPGPTPMRAKKVGWIVIVTDFIGSGRRIWTMLEAFRMVASLRSWKSYRLIRFAVVAYSGTDTGIDLVKSNKLKPLVLTVTACPTITDTFSGSDRVKVLDLCHKYPANAKYPTGYGWTGALIAFAHGMPNNAPDLLHRSKGKWKPLFRNRSSAGIAYTFPQASADSVADRASRILKLRVARKHLDDAKTNTWVQTLLVLQALLEGLRTASQVSARTRQLMADVEITLNYLCVVGWTTPQNKLTPLGRRELQRLYKRRRQHPVLPTSDHPYYYPTQLRAR